MSLKDIPDVSQFSVNLSISRAGRIQSTHSVPFGLEKDIICLYRGQISLIIKLFLESTDIEESSISVPFSFR